MDKYTKVPGIGFLKLSFDGSGAPREFAILNTPVSKRFAGFIMIRRDLDLALNAIDLLKDQKQLIILQQSLLFLAVSTYAKCFIKNDGHRPSLNFNDIFKTADRNIIDEHKRIIHLRNEYVAHAGSQFDQCIVTGTIMRMSGIVVGIDVNSQLTHTVNMPPKLQEFADLCTFVKQKVELKSTNAFAQIRQSIGVMNQDEFKRLRIITPDTKGIYKMEKITSGDGSVLVEYVLSSE